MSGNDQSIRNVISSPILLLWIDRKYLKLRYINYLRKTFLSQKPFPHLALNAFLKNPRCKRLISLLRKQKFHIKSKRKHFEYLRTAEFGHLRNPYLREFKEFLSSSELTCYINYITGLNLPPKAVIMSGKLYREGQEILPHSDSGEDRKLAFVLFLNSLKEKDGGSLVLYKKNSASQIKEKRKIRPFFNDLIIFQVSSGSIHAVTPVNQGSKRYTVSGWFYINKR